MVVRKLCYLFGRTHFGSAHISRSYATRNRLQRVSSVRIEVSAIADLTLPLK